MVGLLFPHLINMEGLRPDLSIWVALVLLIENNAVSAEEKKADRISKTDSTVIYSDILSIVPYSWLDILVNIHNPERIKLHP